MNITMGSIITITIAVLLIRFASKFIIKLLGWTLLVAIGVYTLYHFSIGPFAKNPISLETWEDKYCKDIESAAKCDCIVQPIKNDLETRFTQSELQTIEQNRAQMLYVVQRSFKAVEVNIQQCLKSANAESELEDFKNDLIPIDNDVIEELKHFAEGIKDGAKHQLDEMTSTKEKIDKKYE